MTVERISFPDGLLMAVEGDPGVGIANAVSRGVGIVNPLPAGEYDITPAQMTHNKYRYNLIVKPDGTGVCRMTPVFPDSMIMELDSGEQRMGGKQISIVEGSPGMIIAGPDQRGRGVLIYECLMYVPGRSPEA